MAGPHTPAASEQWLDFGHYEASSSVPLAAVQLLVAQAQAVLQRLQLLLLPGQSCLLPPQPGCHSCPALTVHPVGLRWGLLPVLLS